MTTLYYVYETPSGEAGYGVCLPESCQAIGIAATEEGAQTIAATWFERKREASPLSKPR